MQKNECERQNLKCINFQHCEINWLPNIARSCHNWASGELPAFLLPFANISGFDGESCFKKLVI